MRRVMLLVTLAAATAAGASTLRQTCFKSGEQVDGLSKLCYYRCTCGTKVLNMKAYELCPVTAEFECF